MQQNGETKRPVGRPKGRKAVKYINFHLDEDLYIIARMRCELPSFTKYLNNLIRKALMTE